jgi:hypothetical protein
VKTRHVKITGGPAAHTIRIEIDGVPDYTIEKIAFEADAYKDACRVTVTFPAKVEIDVDVDVETIGSI